MVNEKNFLKASHQFLPNKNISYKILHEQHSVFRSEIFCRERSNKMLTKKFFLFKILQISFKDVFSYNIF